MNALVEDQMQRLRKALDSDEAHAWLKEHRGDNRFYFGRYTGQTPVAGHEYPAKRDKLRAELQEMDRTMRSIKRDIQRAQQLLDNAQNADEKKDAEQKLAEQIEKLHFFPRMDGAEMLTRWDMQSHPPDILITNYSMLNIMLLRDQEKGMIEQTRAWIESDPNHVLRWSLTNCICIAAHKGQKLLTSFANCCIAWDCPNGRIKSVSLPPAHRWNKMTMAPETGINI
ncbi:MAG: hypothetical protein M5U34_04540 [Chloroflexi bacterium]|nr:hypothetical protein [Chloroflexota bacterium]